MRIKFITFSLIAYLFIFNCNDKVQLKHSHIGSKLIDTINFDKENFEYDLEMKFSIKENKKTNNTSIERYPESTANNLKLKEEDNPKNEKNKQLNKRKKPQNTILSKADILKKEIQKLEKIEDYYFNIHINRIQNRLYRSISYTRLKENEYATSITRKGKKKEHLKIIGKSSLNPKDLNLKSYYNSNLIELTKSLIKTLSDYCLVISLENNKKITLADFNSLLDIKIMVPQATKKYKLIYKGEYGYLYERKYRLNNKFIKSEITQNNYLNSNDLGFLLGLEAYIELENHFSDFKNFDHISVYYSQGRDFIVYITLELQDFFLNEYAQHLQDVNAAKAQIEILKDSIHRLDKSHSNN